jgi:peptidylprolyl isomerase
MALLHPTRAMVAFAVALMALALTACGSGSSATNSGSIILQGREGRPDVPVPAGPPPAELVVKDLKEGTGPGAEKGGEISLRYFRFTYRDHKMYEDKWREAPISHTLGTGQLVEAWERGLIGMKAEGRRELILPAKMTFAKVPEIYVIDAVSVKPPKRSTNAARVEKVPATGTKPKMTVPPGPPPKELVVRELKAGTGGRVRVGERIGVRFMDVNYKTKNVQDFWTGEQPGSAPYSFILGQGRVREGWEIAIPGTKLGTRLELLLPSRLAYGDGPMRYVIEFLERENHPYGEG